MRHSVSIITPTTGAGCLAQCIESVQAQQYRNIEHIVVIDGKSRTASVRGVLADKSNVVVVEIPYTTGSEGYQGHRIYAAMPYLLNSDFVCYLDEDNWIEPNHISDLLKLVLRFKLDWAHSLRRIVRRDGSFLFNDNCNSLGRWPSFDGTYHHVDTSCYFLRRSVACTISKIWNRSSSGNAGCADRMVCKCLIEAFPAFHTSGNYTLNYRLGSRQAESEAISFYEQGNRLSAETYKTFPWTTSQIARRSKRHPHFEYKGGTIITS